MKIAIDINDVIRDFTRGFIITYQKNVNKDMDIDVDDVTDFDFKRMFGFKSTKEYESFRYYDYVFELYCSSGLCDNRIPSELNYWIMNTLGDIDEDVEVMLFSPFEIGMTIQATLGFLSTNVSRAREYYFPVDSMSVYDRADIVITANPNLIENCPEGKTVVKINRAYNKDIECGLSFDGLLDVINDEDEKIIKIIKGE